MENKNISTDKELAASPTPPIYTRKDGLDCTSILITKVGMAEPRTEQLQMLDE
jgi:hypothetical protein